MVNLEDRNNPSGPDQTTNRNLPDFPVADGS